MTRAWLFVTLGLFVCAALIGCGGGSDGKKNGNAADTVNCEDYCARMMSCVVFLCEEDLGRPVHESSVDEIETTCATACMDGAFNVLAARHWDCLFENSCRAVFGDDVCDADAHYTCAG